MLNKCGFAAYISIEVHAGLARLLDPPLLGWRDTVSGFAVKLRP